MTLARKTAVSRTDMRTKIRTEADDPATNRSAVAIPAAQRRYSDTECDDAFDFALMELGRELGGMDVGENLVYADGTYTADAVSAAFPSGPTAGDLIYKVEDLTDSSRPLPIEYVSVLEIENYAVSTQTALVPLLAYRYTMFFSGTTAHISIRPRPKTAMPIRVWYVAPPVVIGADADTHPYTSHWYEYLVLASALKLLRRDDEGSQQQLEDMARLRRQVQSFGNRQAGPQRIRIRRRGR